MKKQFTLIAWITLIMALLLSSCQKFEEDAIQKLAYGKDESGRHFVDLGLSVKWATCNIGAEAPEQQGLLYAWGETSPKEEYTWDNYKFGPDTALSKYCAKPDVAWHGFTDAKTTLELSDDAAHVNWRGRWRMPTQAEWNELIEKCTWTQTEYMGVKGYDVKASNGNRIFLPAPDENALYASSSLLETRPDEALHLPIFDQYDVLTAQYRYRAYSVRAVYGSLLPQYCLITFDANGGEGIMHPQQFSKGALIPLTEVRFTKQASVFSSWNTKADGSGTSYTDRDVVSLTENITLYAQWKLGYTITFDANGGEGIMKKQVFDYGVSQAINKNLFTRYAYLFDGWNVKADGSGQSYTDGETIFIDNHLILYAQWKRDASFGEENGHYYVDLGLPSGLKWATCNVGAATPEAYGDYFAWGETSPKDDYSWSTYKYCGGPYNNITKYCTDIYYGTVDNKTILELSDDAARANWGGTWRMPTGAEIEELLNNCTWTKALHNGVEGCKVTSKTNGNSIFLPAAGNRFGTSVFNVGFSGFYWSSSLFESDPYDAYYLKFRPGDVGYSYRYDGHTVRAVCP
ncbi:MAG: InlB B-repeat-containing protein [Bacteroidales bacterium]|nr:InlB B-repeat-containing protein [Bacteroidales bacterium]